MKRVLFICGSLDYPNGICVKAVADEAEKSGFCVDLICSSSKKLHSHKGIEFHQVKCNFFEGLLNKKGTIKPFTYNMGLFISRIRALILAPVWPLYGPIYYHNLKKAAKRLLRDRTYDVVVGAYNHYECLLAANYVKSKSPKTMLVAYFLDCLSGGQLPRYFSEKKAYKKGLRAEKRALENADRVIIMRSHEKYYQETWKNASWKHKVTVLDIPLYQPIETQKGAIDTENINMLYMGALQQNLKNPQYFLQILENDNFDHLTVSFVGPNDCKKIIDDAKEKTKATLIQKDSVSHDVALKMEEEADVLLNIGSMNTRQIPCKIFEYMSTGKPIVSIAPNKEEPSNYYLSVYPKALVLYESENIEINAKRLNNYICNMATSAMSINDLSERLYICEPKAFISEIMKLIEQNKM